MGILIFMKCEFEIFSLSFYPIGFLHLLTNSFLKDEYVFLPRCEVNLYLIKAADFHKLAIDGEEEEDV